MTRIPEKPFLSPRLTYRLAVLAEEAITANDDIFVRITGCSILQLRLLRLIDDYPGTSFVDISRATGMERSRTSRILRSLMEQGLVQREAVDGDARRYQLTTTTVGKERRQVARRLSDRLESVLLRPLSEADIDALQRSLDALGNWIRSEQYISELMEVGSEFSDV